MPTFSLGLLASRLLHRFFSEKESDRLAGQHSPSPIRHLTAGATSATWANLVPGGWKRKVRTCTCGGGGRLLVVFFFFFLPAPGVLVSPITWRMTSRWADVFSRASANAQEWSKHQSEQPRSHLPAARARR